MTITTKFALMMTSVFGFATLALVLVLNSLFTQLQEQQERQREGLHCALWQLGQHRTNQYASDQQLAAELGTALESPAPPPTDVQVDPNVCDDYFDSLPADGAGSDPD